jgi:sulfite oxidase
VLPGTRVLARGYALTGGARRIERVEVSLDGGTTFAAADLQGGGAAGSWRLWQADLDVGRGPCELVVRAWDSAASTQPENPGEIWNLKGYLNNAWHRVRFSVAGNGDRRTIRTSPPADVKVANG